MDFQKMSLAGETYRVKDITIESKRKYLRPSEANFIRIYAGNFSFGKSKLDKQVQKFCSGRGIFYYIPPWVKAVSFPDYRINSGDYVYGEPLMT